MHHNKRSSHLCHARRLLLILLVLTLSILGSALSLVAHLVSASAAPGDSPPSDGWQQMSGPCGAKINALLVDPQRPQLLYAATSGGLFQSTDGADSWHRVAEPALATQEVLSLAIAPSDTQYVYAGTQRGGVWHSSDGGASWRVSTAGLPSKIIWSLAVDPLDPTRVYAGSDAIYRSDDGGMRWQRLSSLAGISRVTACAVHPLEPNRLYAGTERGIWLSEDGGASWRAAPGWPAGEGVKALLITRGAGADAEWVLLAGTDQGIYRSHDLGVHWMPAMSGGSRQAVTALTCPTALPFILYAALQERAIARSVDGGATWEAIPIELRGGAVTALALDPERPGMIYAGTAATLYRSRDMGGHWEEASRGLVGTHVYDLQRLPNHVGTLLATTRWGIYRSQDDGAAWQLLAGTAPSNALSLLVVPPQTLYAGTWQSEIYRSTDGGETWVRVCENLAGGAPISVLARSTASATVGPDTIYAGTAGAGVWRSRDGGASWQGIHTGLRNPYILALALTSTPSTRLFAGTAEGAFVLELRPDQTRQPLVWQSVADLPTKEVRALAVHVPSGSIYAVTPEELFVSRDGGVEWTRLGARALALHEADMQTVTLSTWRGGGWPCRVSLYLGTDRGILISHDGGTEWQTALPGQWVDRLIVEGSSSQRVFAAVRNGGVWAGVERPPLVVPWAVLLIGAGVVAGLGGYVWLWRRQRAQPSLAETPPATAAQPPADVWDPAVRDVLRRELQASVDTLPTVPEASRLAALQGYYERHQDEDLIWKPAPPTIEVNQARRIQAFLRNCEKAQGSLDQPAAFRTAVSRMTDQLCSALGLTRVTGRTYRHLNAFVVEGAALRLRIPSRFPIIFVRAADFTADDIRDVRDLMDILHVTSYFALVIALCPPAEGEATESRPSSAVTLKRLTKETAHDLIVLDADDLFSIMVAKRRDRALIRTILQQVDLTVVSPYVTYGPVPENMFFGRDQEIKTITRTIADGSFAIVGGRKIGKTSLLSYINRLLCEMPPYRPFYLDCQAIQDYHSLFAAMRSRWQIGAPAEAVADEADPAWFEVVLREIAASQGGVATDSVVRSTGGAPQVVFLLDEVDALLTYDLAHHEQLMRLFRTLSQENRCRFVFCGELVLHQRLRDPQSPLFNFCQVVRLSFLTPESARQVVVEPMQELGVLPTDPEPLVAQIIELSCAHPNILQYICQQLLVQVNGREVREITIADLDAVSASRFFVDYYLAVMWGDATPLEKIITLLMVDRSLLTIDELLRLLTEERPGWSGMRVSAAEVEAAIEHLALCSVLDRERQYVTYAAHSFPDIVDANEDVSALLASLRQEHLALADAAHVEGGAHA